VSEFDDDGVHRFSLAGQLSLQQPASACKRS
jgi:hypothetical protein